MGRQPRERDGSGANPTDGGRDVPAPKSRPCGGIDAFDALFVRQPIRPGASADVREAIANWVDEWDATDARALLPVDGVNVVTLFLDGGDLLWYVEVIDDDASPWRNPEDAIRDRSPLFDTELAELVTPTATTYADGVEGRRLITHATHPDRQAWYESVCDRWLVAPVAGDDLPIEVATATFAVEPGLATRLVDAGVRVGNWLKGFDAIEDRIHDRTAVLAEERMYGETLLFDPNGTGGSIHYYMECESMEQLYDAYEASRTIEVRGSDWIMRRIFEDAEAVVERPLDTDAAVLVHAVDPNRS